MTFQTTTHQSVTTVLLMVYSCVGWQVLMFVLMLDTNVMAGLVVVTSLMSLYQSALIVLMIRQSSPVETEESWYAWTNMFINVETR